MSGSGGDGRNGGELSGFRIGHVPAGVGDLVSDFATEWDDVRFASRVWERETAEGVRVDLRVHVLRGDRLATLADLRDFLAEYHERDPADAAFTEFRHGELPGLVGATEAFWLVTPGVAVDVLLDATVGGQPELLAVATGVDPLT
ncbi:hypothetical protein [Micromonospora sp. NBRC 101691]|uniref:hypothetical protein n=1 Tax=Micromonospora sp. NBRC 101691 TaxID=3032198 RepID=UPI0024A3955B|nr:hypothetical protein [Micromonospora sp. NBRC 101691]GLY20539.1 hypothetical protein Misp04_02710 [Micromonospora sp. NBRC 101691]